MKRLLAVFAITVLAAQYASAGSLQPRLRRETNSVDNDIDAKKILSDLLNAVLNIPRVNEMLTNWTKQMNSIDHITAGSLSSIINALSLCAMDNEDMQNCWRHKMAPVMCESFPRIIDYQITDPMMRPMLEMGVNTGLKVLQMC